MKTKKTRKPGKKPAKRKNAKSRPVAKKTSQRARKIARETVRPRIGRASGIVQSIRNKYSSVRDELVRKYAQARERLAKFYKKYRIPIEAIGVGSLAGLGVGAIAYGINDRANFSPTPIQPHHVASAKWGPSNSTGPAPAAPVPQPPWGAVPRKYYDPTLPPLYNQLYSGMGYQEFQSEGAPDPEDIYPYWNDTPYMNALRNNLYTAFPQPKSSWIRRREEEP